MKRLMIDFEKSSKREENFFNSPDALTENQMVAILEVTEGKPPTLMVNHHEDNSSSLLGRAFKECQRMGIYE